MEKYFFAQKASAGVKCDGIRQFKHYGNAVKSAYKGQFRKFTVYFGFLMFTLKSAPDYN